MRLNHVEKPRPFIRPLTLYVTGSFYGILMSLLVIYGILWEIYGMTTI